MASGADDILIVTGRGKRALEDHFDYNPEFEGSAKYPEMQHLADLGRQARIHFVPGSENPEVSPMRSAWPAITPEAAPFGVLLRGMR